MKHLRLTFLKRLRDDEEGSAPVEGLLGTLLLLGWYVVAFQFWDAYRTRSTVTKAAYTISDMISRETDFVGPNYVAGLRKVFNYVADARSPEETLIRVTLFNCTQASASDTRPCDGVSKAFDIIDGYSTDSDRLQPYTKAGLNAEHDRIPRMAVGDMAVLVETSYIYRPIFDIGDRTLQLGDPTTGTVSRTRIGLPGRITYNNFVVTRPRVTRVVWSNGA